MLTIAIVIVGHKLVILEMTAVVHAEISNCASVKLRMKRQTSFSL